MAPGCAPRRCSRSSAAGISPGSARSGWRSSPRSPRASAGPPAELSRLTAGLLGELTGALTPLLDVGLGYLHLDRAGASLSTGERQRIELTSTVRASTTGMLYVLDEPSVGLHPSNVEGLAHDDRRLLTATATHHHRGARAELIRAADWIIELGPGAGTQGGRIVAQGTAAQLEARPGLHPRALPGRHGGRPPGPGPAGRPAAGQAPAGEVTLTVGDLYNLHDVTAASRSPAYRAGPAVRGRQNRPVLDSLSPPRVPSCPGSVRHGTQNVSGTAALNGGLPFSVGWLP